MELKKKKNTVGGLWPKRIRMGNGRPISSKLRWGKEKQTRKENGCPYHYLYPSIAAFTLCFLTCINEGHLYFSRYLSFLLCFTHVLWGNNKILKSRKKERNGTYPFDILIAFSLRLLVLGQTMYNLC